MVDVRAAGEIAVDVPAQEATLNREASVAPTTTAQQDMTTAGQRRINLIWEYTQAFIAIAVVLANLVTGVTFGIYRIPSGEYPFVLSSSLFLIVGFYFSRTNHQAIGGVGQKPIENEYKGR